MSKRSRRSMLWGAVLAAASLALLGAGDPEVDAGVSDWPQEPPGSITFKARNLFGTANGVFHRWRINRVEIDPANPSSGVVEIEIDVASVDTGIKRRDTHLRTADFFEVAQFPTARVTVRDAAAADDSSSRYRAQFDLEIHGVTQTVEAEFEVVSTSPPEVRGELTLDRSAFEVGKSYNRWNPMSVRDEVVVTFQALL